MVVYDTIVSMALDFLFRKEYYRPIEEILSDEGLDDSADAVEDFRLSFLAGRESSHPFEASLDNLRPTLIPLGWSSNGGVAYWDVSNVTYDPLAFDRETFNTLIGAGDVLVERGTANDDSVLQSIIRTTVTHPDVYSLVYVSLGKNRLSDLIDGLDVEISTSSIKQASGLPQIVDLTGQVIDVMDLRAAKVSSLDANSMDATMSAKTDEGMSVWDDEPYGDKWIMLIVDGLDEILDSKNDEGLVLTRVGKEHLVDTFLNRLSNILVNGRKNRIRTVVRADTVESLDLPKFDVCIKSDTRILKTNKADYINVPVASLTRDGMSLPPMSLFDWSSNRVGGIDSDYRELAFWAILDMERRKHRDLMKKLGLTAIASSMILLPLLFGKMK